VPADRDMQTAGTKHKAYIDWSLIVIVVFLLAFGLVILYSASYYEASMSKDCNYDPMFYLKKQLQWSAVGLAAMTAMAFIPHSLWKKLSKPMFLVSVAMIFLCLAFPAVNGAQRWVRIGGFSIQPAEVVKITTIFLMGAMITKLGTRLYMPKVAIGMLIYPTVAAALLYFITDNLSSAIIVLLIALGMFFVSRTDYWKFILGAILIIGLAALAVWLVINNDDVRKALGFRASRIVAWRDPQANGGKYGFQTQQALYAIGSGGWFGKGLGRSMQKLGYIPEVQNDMIFSIICEELGVFGAISIILMFILLCWRLMFIADNATDSFGSYIAVGVFCHIAVQVFLNIAVVTNTIPNTGVTLPFISYGGSSVIFTLIEIGAVLNVARGIQTNRN
jgi:cell division protein FtsW